MSDSHSVSVQRAFVANALEAAVRIGLVALLAAWCLMIIRPFVEPMTWAIIIAVAVYPLYLHLANSLQGRTKLAATLFTLLALAILITPTMMLTVSLVDSAQTLSAELKDGRLHVPPPPDSVAEWPLVGERLHAFWTLASQNLEGALTRVAPQLEAAGKWLLSGVAGTGGSVLKFVLSIIIAGVLLANAEAAARVARAILERVTGERGAEFATLAGATVRSVAQGVLGVAAIQGFLAGIGLLVMGVPAAGLWAVLVLLLAVVQLPPILILGPIIVYVFNVADTVPAVLFMIWSILVSMSDAFLKPMLLGRGLETPMLVILLGAIGGMVMSGIIGLFIGSVILAVGYELFMAWLMEKPQQDPQHG